MRGIANDDGFSPLCHRGTEGRSWVLSAASCNSPLEIEVHGRTPIAGKEIDQLLPPLIGGRPRSLDGGGLRAGNVCEPGGPATRIRHYPKNARRPKIMCQMPGSPAATPRV